MLLFCLTEARQSSLVVLRAYGKLSLEQRKDKSKSTWCVRCSQVSCARDTLYLKTELAKSVSTLLATTIENLEKKKKKKCEKPEK